MGATGIEPVTPAMSTQCSTAELSAHDPWYNPADLCPGPRLTYHQRSQPASPPALPSAES